MFSLWHIPLECEFHTQISAYPSAPHRMYPVGRRSFPASQPSAQGTPPLTWMIDSHPHCPSCFYPCPLFCSENAEGPCKSLNCLCSTAPFPLPCDSHLVRSQYLSLSNHVQVPLRPAPKPFLTSSPAISPLFLCSQHPGLLAAFSCVLCLSCSPTEWLPTCFCSNVTTSEKPTILTLFALRLYPSWLYHVFLPLYLFSIYPCRVRIRALSGSLLCSQSLGPWLGAWNVFV